MIEFIHLENTGTVYKLRYNEDGLEKIVTDMNPATYNAVQNLVKAVETIVAEESERIAELEALRQKYVGYLLQAELTPEEMLALMEIFPLWSENAVSYAVDDKVRYSNKLYRVIQAHTSQIEWAPPVAVSLFVEIVPPEVIPDWLQPTGAHDAYNTGDRVLYNGKVYESLIDGNVWSPVDYPTGWALI